MFLGIGNIVALVSIIISIILAVGYNQTAKDNSFVWFGARWSRSVSHFCMWQTLMLREK